MGFQAGYWEGGYSVIDANGPFIRTGDQLQFQKDMESKYNQRSRVAHVKFAGTLENQGYSPSEIQQDTNSLDRGWSRGFNDGAKIAREDASAINLGSGGRTDSVRHQDAQDALESAVFAEAERIGISNGDALFIVEKLEAKDSGTKDQ